MGDCARLGAAQRALEGDRDIAGFDITGRQSFADDPHHERRMAMASALPGTRVAAKGLDPRDLPDAGGLRTRWQEDEQAMRAYVAGLNDANCRHGALCHTKASSLNGSCGRSWRM